MPIRVPSILAVCLLATLLSLTTPEPRVCIRIEISMQEVREGKGINRRDREKGEGEVRRKGGDKKGGL